MKTSFEFALKIDVHSTEISPQLLPIRLQKFAIEFKPLLRPHEKFETPILSSKVRGWNLTKRSVRHAQRISASGILATHHLFRARQSSVVHRHLLLLELKTACD